MNFFFKQQFLRWVTILVSFVIVVLILWNTYVFFQHFKKEEQTKMLHWSMAYKDFNTGDLDKDINELTTEILTNNKTTPMILVNRDGDYTTKNIDEEKAQDPRYIEALKNEFKSQNKPIVIEYQGSVDATIYYGNSPLLNKLKYYPLALLLIIFLFVALGYLYYKSSQAAVQNKLWSGMAKETAHQIGTPLSSLIGWTEILKSEHINQTYVSEIEKDIERLQTITERFSKIGSVPILKPKDIIATTISAYEYMKRRSSKLIKFEISTPNKPIPVNLNPQLYAWTIENLLKNSIDAMKGKGVVTITITSDINKVYIQISDTGKGIEKSNTSKIFEPGFTTKKRGWGLGLSLAKRIIEDYHKGKIKVLTSEKSKGTTMQIMLPIMGT
jgi:two-component system, sporulation sensor kinase D